MSNPAERVAEDEYERDNDDSPVTGDFEENSYVRETAPSLQNQVPIQTDNEPVEDPVQPPYSNSDQQLAEDEREAINKSNIMRGERLRHAKPRTSNRYNEGPGEDELPTEAT